MYACPQCKSDLRTSKCAHCGFEIRFNGDIPIFFTESDVSKIYENIGAFYDNFYGKIDDAWNRLAARGPEFNRYVAALVQKGQPQRYLDVGCGEGYLLAAIEAPEKSGMESQPIERLYTPEKVRRIFENVGFMISELITKRKCPDAPLAGHHFRIYVLHKKMEV